MTLDEAIDRETAIGARLVSRTARTATLEIGTPVNHVLHLLVTVLTCGLWLPMWAFFGVTGGTRRCLITEVFPGAYAKGGWVR